ncbi:MAG: tannase/feruloyl esterase family alpha/beta hydrolase [Rubrobacteraceae bacterium]
MEVEGEARRSKSPKVFLAALLCLAVFAPLFMYVGSVDADDGEAELGRDSGGNSGKCPKKEGAVTVPGADFQDADCLRDLTTAGTQETGHTDRKDWDGLHAEGTENPSGVPGLHVDGCFPDDSTTNTTSANIDTNNTCEHDSQFVIRFPNDWNGKLVITGAPGVREQYANDFIISDYVLDKGYAFASTDKGNTGVNFYDDGSEPGGSIAEWHERVEQLTRATKKAAKDNYGKRPERTYITGISNGGYLTRYALENTPELYDGGVDWEGTLFLEEGPNLLTFLPPTLRNYPECKTDRESGQSLEESEACQNIVEAGFAPESEFLWDEHYTIYWDLTQRIYREEFDPEYDGALKAGIPFCQPGTPNCDADYDYDERPQEVRDAMGSVSNTGDIGKPMITLHGTLDTLLPIEPDSDVYRKLVKEEGNKKRHRYYVIDEGNHVDSFYEGNEDRLRPMLPCHRTAFDDLVAWVERGKKPPKNQFVNKPKGGDVVNSCEIGKEE